MLSANKNVELAKDFELCAPAIAEEDVYNFVSNLADVFMGAAQYNSQIHPNISQLCSVMTNASRSAYENLRVVMGVSLLNPSALPPTAEIYLF